MDFLTKDFKGDFNEGVAILVNKPLTWTSFDVVKKIRTTLRKVKVGHAGTLDPLATGLLIVCVGKYTKRFNELQGLDKRYTGTITLGASTPSYDLETKPENHADYQHLSEEDIRSACAKFIGVSEQHPPVFSAVKVDGKPMYKKARKGVEVRTEARQIELFSFEISNVRLPEVDFEVHCSKGTYIRSLAHDFGASLEVGGHLSSLTRTAIGPYRLTEAWDIQELATFLREKSEISA